jgi:hypothetical protein
MLDVNPEVERLRRQHAGRYVAWLGDEVYLSAETYDDLLDRLDQMPINQGKLIFEYLDPIDAVHIYSPRVCIPEGSR